MVRKRSRSLLVAPNECRHDDMEKKLIENAITENKGVTATSFLGDIAKGILFLFEITNHY